MKIHLNNSSVARAGNSFSGDRRGTIGILLAVLMPGLLIAVALGIEATGWMTSTVSLQRTADIAASAGLLNYQKSQSGFAATTTAVQMAKLNGVVSTSTPTWNASTQTLTADNITAQMISPMQDPSNKAMRVTLQNGISATISQFFSSKQTYTVGSASTGELSPQVCFLSLSTNSNLAVGAGASMSATNCVMRSNAGIAATGGGSATALDFYAAGGISSGGSSVLTGRQHPNQAVLADPYATYAPVQSALSQLVANNGTPIDFNNGTVDLSPGTYSSLTVRNGAIVNLLPGLYYVNGDINVKNSGQLTGTGVTIITSGQVQFGQSSLVNLSAQSGTGSAIPGVLFAGTTTGNVAFTSTSTATLTGVVYFPNATLNVTSATAVATPCLEYIVSSASITAAGSLSGNCASMGAQGFGAKGSKVMAFLVK